MDTISGIPAHPLLVHLPVVLLPLTALGVVTMVIRPAWAQRFRWPVLALGVVGMLGAILSASAGETLEERLRASGQADTWADHAQAGEQARNVAILFVFLLALYVLVPWWLQRSRPSRPGAASPPSPPTWLGATLSVLAVAGAIGSVITIVDAGHSGAKAVWTEQSRPSTATAVATTTTPDPP